MIAARYTLLAALLMLSPVPASLNDDPAERRSFTEDDRCASHMNRVAEAGRNLRPIGRTVAVASERFVAADHFWRILAGDPGDARSMPSNSVKLGYVDEIFLERFDVVEFGVTTQALRFYDLLTPALDTAIIGELADCHETRISLLWSLLAQQPEGEVGPLRTDGNSNVFYIRDARGILWAVSATWTSGWDIGIHPIDGPYPWRAQRRIVAR